MQYKIFAHRGLTNNFIKENSIKALINAADNGFNAIECDIFYYNKKLLLSHDQPDSIGQLDDLEGFLEIFAGQMQYWLDFKNLTIENALEVLPELKRITDKLHIEQKNLFFAPFITEINPQTLLIYQIIKSHFNQAQILAVKEKLAIIDYQSYYQQLKDNDIYGLSIQFSNINSEFMKVFSDRQIFAWTVDRKKDLINLAQLGVKNVTSNKLLPEEG
jgi:glycerophosphoryl diester phosphodiesterase